MKVTCIGAAGVVTGSSYLIEAECVKILVDCGMFQGSRQMEERNHLDFLYDPRTVDYLLLTHAHIDHSGLIPKLVRDGFSGAILSTPATADLCRVMLADSAHIQQMESEWRNNKKKRAGRTRFIEPLYIQDDVEETLRYFQPAGYGQYIVLSSGVSVRFNDAGHILGSAIIELWIKENGREVKIVFSGDLGSTHQPIIPDPVSIKEADVVFIESTYGNRLHRSKENTYQELKEVIIAARKDGGNVIIPAFAVERTQEVLYILNELYRKKEIPCMDVYLDSPLAISATEIFLTHPECFDEETIRRLRTGDNPLGFPGMHFSRSTEESMRLNQIEKNAIIIAASGMCHAGRIKHHLRNNLWRREAHVVIVGYQAQGTTGRLIVDGARHVKIFGEEVAVAAKIHTIGGLSAHADRDGLLRWLDKFDPKPAATVIVHGETDSSRAFAGYAAERLGLIPIVPQLGEIIDLDIALGKFKKEGFVFPSLEFDTELDRAWEGLDNIITRMEDIEDIPDIKVRESLSPKLREINKRLAEIGDYLAGKEIWREDRSPS
ncbi:MAG: MBL fold metallo-hydrolase [Thermodesulfobacteriota bacterium]|nr:MBL fold metallo-hydrolase [Thermodesulfobacteriota bacterium]